MGLLDKFTNFSNSINDRISNSLLPINNPLGLLDEGTAQGIQRQALLQGGANLLQNSGPSTTPRTLGQNVGSAIETGQAAQAGLTSQALQNQLLRSQTNRNNAAAAAPPSGTNSRFGSPQITESGRIITLDRQSGRAFYADSGEPWDSASDPISADLQVITLPDGSQRLVNMRSNLGTDGAVPESSPGFDPAAPAPTPPPRTTELVTPEEALAGAEQKVLTEARARTQAQREEAAPVTFSAAEAAIANLRMIQNQSRQIRNHPGLPSATGFGGETISGISGTPAADAAALIGTLRAQTFASALQAMRDASQTGGAVGQVSDAEGARFESQWAAVVQSQSSQQFASELEKLERIADEGIERIMAAYQREFDGISTAPAFDSAPVRRYNPETGRIE